MTETLHCPNNYRKDYRSYRSPHSSSYRLPYRRDSHRYRSRSYSRDITFQKYTSSFRPPSRRLRDSRHSRCRSRSNTRNKINTIQPQPSNDPINFEVHMFHPANMANGLAPPSWFYSLYTHTRSSK